MNIQKILITASIALTFAFVGCNKQGASVDTAPLEKSFQSADAPAKSTSDSIVAEIKSANYSGAVSDLTKLAQNTKLSAEQQQAVKDILAQVEKALADTAAKAGADASKTATDLQKSLPKP